MPYSLSLESGPQALLAWIDRQGLNQTQAARKLGMGKDFLNHIVRERSNVGLHTALRIERVTGIPVEVWDSPTVDKTDPPRTLKARKRRIDKDSTPCA